MARRQACAGGQGAAPPAVQELRGCSRCPIWAPDGGRAAAGLEQTLQWVYVLLETCRKVLAEGWCDLLVKALLTHTREKKNNQG